MATLFINNILGVRKGGDIKTKVDIRFPVTEQIAKVFIIRS